MDYASKLAPDTAEFIRATEEFAASDTSNGSIEGQRQAFEALCQHFRHDHPPGLTVQDQACGGVMTRRYSSQKPAACRLAYFHGGGFVVGSLDSHDSICADLATVTGMELTAVDYRLAPEHPYPAAYEDCLAVRDAMLAEDDRPLVLVGDSAGGWLAAMVAAENPKLIHGQVLIYPMLGAPMHAESYRTHADAPLLSTEAIGWYWEKYMGDAPRDAAVEPLALADLSGQPETHIIGAALDPLADDGPLYAARLKESGTAVTCHVAPGLPHGFLRARHHTSDAAQAWDKIITACRSFA